MSSKQPRDIFDELGTPHEKQEPPRFDYAVNDFRRGDIMVRLRGISELQQRPSNETTVQALMQDAINLLMVHYEKDPVI